MCILPYIGLFYVSQHENQQTVINQMFGLTRFSHKPLTKIADVHKDNLTVIHLILISFINAVRHINFVSDI